MNKSTRFRAVGVIAMLAVMALFATVLAAQEGTTRPLTPTARPVVDAYPEGDIGDTTPYFGVTYEPGLASSITWFNVRVNDGATVLLDAWYEVAEACESTELESICYAFPDAVLHAGVGDKALTWTLSEYNSQTEVVTEIDTYDFTIQAIVPVGPVTFSEESGSPQFEIEALETPYDRYRIYVINADTNAVVFDEWVFVDAVDCGGDPCINTLEPPMAPIYDDADYTLYAQGYNFLGTSAWSEGFDFTVDYSGLGDFGPSVGFSGFAEVFYFDEFLENILIDGVLCEPPSMQDDPFVCDTTTPGVLFFVADHDEKLPPLVPVQENLRIDDTIEAADIEDYPIVNATQWFNYRLTDSNDIDIVNEWINTYANDRCINPLALGGLRLAEIPSGGACVFELPELEPGTYTLGWSTYNPGGISEEYTYDLTITGSPPPLDLEDVETPQMSEVEIEVNDVNVYLIWTDENFLPKWVHFIITDTDSNAVVVDEWLEAQDLIELQTMYIESVLASGDFNLLPIYDVLGDTLVCFFDACETLLNWNPVNGNYELVIETWVGGNTVSAPSAPIAFSISNGVPVIDAMSLDVLRMFDLSGETRPTYVWTASENGAWYNFQLEDDNGVMLLDEWFRWGVSCTDVSMSDDVTCEYQPPSTLAPGDYTWRVRAWGPGGLGDFTADQTLNIANDPLTVPVIVSPQAAGNPFSSTPEFVFNPASNASWYQLEVIDPGENITLYSEWFYKPISDCDPMGTNECVIDEFDTLLNLELLSGDYTWRVRGATATAISNWTSAEPFTVEATMEGIAGLSPIEDYYTSDEITFYWEAGPANEWYNLNLWRFDAEEAIVTGSEPLTRADLGEPTYSQWFNEIVLGDACTTENLLYFLRPDSQPDVLLPLFHCEYTITDLEDGYYFWVVDAWGPTYGNDILLTNEDGIGVFVKQ